jgi:acyl-CoA reductase-like NAD-dependent aldehyde dehydrogenase
MAAVRDQAYWLQKLTTMTIEGRAFINGRYVDAVAGELFDCHSPRDGRLLAAVQSCHQADADIAVAAAKAAFDTGVWSETSPKYRKKVLLRFADLMAQHQEELALLESLDMGKPVLEADSIDITESIGSIRWHAEAIDKVFDQVCPTSSDVLGMVTREPLGVIAAIVPWNYPLLMACWKLGPALATGNSVIVKPSEKSPLTMIRVAALATEAGLPDGVLNVLPGFGDTVGQALALHMDVEGLAFTGSTATGKRLLQFAGESNMKRAFMECGGKSPNIVFADAPNLDKLAVHVAESIFHNQGEVCTAASRLLIDASIKTEFVNKVVAAAAEMQPGDPLNSDAFMGAIVDDSQLANIKRMVAMAQDEGAELRCGGEQVRADSGGYYFAPTIFDNVDNRMKIAQHEVFGPVLTVISFETEEEAIAIANDTIYGLAAGVWTTDLGRAHRVAKKVRAGSMWVNTWDGGDMTTPFGGFKQSGNGRDKSLHAMEKYTELKSVWINLDY